jgi:hypothetical protein
LRRIDDDSMEHFGGRLEALMKLGGIAQAG